MEALSKEQHTANLRRLIVILQGVRPEHFDMIDWGRHVGEHAPETDNYCGMAACALGHAVLNPEFQKQGVTPDWYTQGGTDYDTGRPIYRLRFRWQGGPPMPAPLVSEFLFGMTEEEHDDLFAATWLRRGEVIEALEELAEDRAELAAAAADAEVQP